MATVTASIFRIREPILSSFQKISEKSESSHADGGPGLLVPLHGRGIDAGMDRCIIGAHIVLEQLVELRLGGDGIQVQRIEPGLLEHSELALDLGLGCTVTDLRI